MRKQYKNDDQVFRDIQEAIGYALTPYIGARYAEDTIHNNGDLLNRIYPMSEYLGYVVRYFQFREEHPDMGDADLFEAFEREEAER